MYQREFDAAFYIIKKAADVIRDGYFSTISISYKEDKSPVTNIDKKVDELIRTYLTFIARSPQSFIMIIQPL